MYLRKNQTDRSTTPGIFSTFGGVVMFVHTMLNICCDTGIESVVIAS